MNASCNTQAKRELIRLGEQALADSELYIAHLDSLFSSSLECLRGGSDAEGLHVFSRAVADLEQFLQLTEQLRAAARPANAAELDAFQCALQAAAGRLHTAILSDELLAISDEIEHGMLDTFAKWPQAAAELEQGLACQLAEAAG